MDTAASLLWDQVEDQRLNQLLALARDGKSEAVGDLFRESGLLFGEGES